MELPDSEIEQFSKAIRKILATANLKIAARMRTQKS